MSHPNVFYTIGKIERDCGLDINKEIATGTLVKEKCSDPWLIHAVVYRELILNIVRDFDPKQWDETGTWLQLDPEKAPMLLICLQFYTKTQEEFRTYVEQHLHLLPEDLRMYFDLVLQMIFPPEGYNYHIHGNIIDEVDDEQVRVWWQQREIYGLGYSETPEWTTFIEKVKKEIQFPL